MKNGLIVDDYGTKEYYMNGKLHRVDGPAIEYINGSTFWWFSGKKHRVDGPAELWLDCSKRWYLNGKKHRVDGPAEEFAHGEKRWYLHGKLHRVDGPAVEWETGKKVWWLNGEKLIHPEEFKTMEEFIKQLNANEKYSLPWINNINGIIEVIKNPTDKQKRLNVMKWKI